jgi:hypothetical protein
MLVVSLLNLNNVLFKIAQCFSDVHFTQFLVYLASRQTPCCRVHLLSVAPGSLVKQSSLWPRMELLQPRSDP